MRRGFTLVELMVAIAIVGILASVAIPAYTKMQLKAKRAEVKVNSEGLFDTLYVYVTTEDPTDAINLGFNPSPSPAETSVNGKTARTWNEGVGGDDLAVWEMLGWSPDGDVRCSYRATWSGPSDVNNYSTTAECDLDNDSDRVLYYILGPATSASGARKEHVDVYPLNF